jgi:hypothetical protein
MTDHSILTPSLPELPFQEEVRLISRIITFFGTKAPEAVGTAIDARDLFEIVSELNNEQIATLGIDRTGIAAYVAEKTGLFNL